MIAIGLLFVRMLCDSFKSRRQLEAEILVLRHQLNVLRHRTGFAAYWRWKSGPLGGRPQIGKEVRDLIRRMSFENPLWGAPKIHGELLKLGFEVAQSTVSIYMVSRRDRPLQTRKTFLCNHMEGIASIDLLWFRRLPLSNCSRFLFSAIDGGNSCGLR